jgi:hypothetical protein
VGEATDRGTGDPEAGGLVIREGGRFERREGKKKRERLFFSALVREDLGGLEAQGSKGPRPGLILRGAQRGFGFPVGGNRWSTGGRLKGLHLKCRSGAVLGNEGRITGRRKASKGKPRERWGLKETFEGRKG